VVNGHGPWLDSPLMSFPDLQWDGTVDGTAVTGVQVENVLVISISFPIQDISFLRNLSGVECIITQRNFRGQTNSSEHKGLKIDLGINPKKVHDLLSFLNSDKPFEKNQRCKNP
jgi:hypothetical protein